MTNLGILLASVHKVTRKTVKFDSALPRISFLIALNTHTHTHKYTHSIIQHLPTPYLNDFESV